MSFGPFYSGARCDAKARGQIIRALAEHQAQREKSGILAIFGPSRCTRTRALGTVWVLVGTVVYVQGDLGMSNGAECRGDKSRGIL